MHVAGRGLRIAPTSLKALSPEPIRKINAECGGGGEVEVDRVARMGPVTPERTPAWIREELRRRRFVVEVEPELEDQADDSTGEQDKEDSEAKGDLDVMA